ncbi:hypothetical protein, partial [Staphylococcus aureus]|uniref:hypothetical protein n=1 Tax=Staphylococcus aureus TaxID=1280 RepID=UPI001CD04EF2
QHIKVAWHDTKLPQQHIIALHQDASWYQHIKVTCHDTKFPQQYVITSHHHTTTSMSSRDNSIP